MMEDRLKNIKSEIKEITFKDLQFDTEQRQAVFQKMKNREDGLTQMLNKHRNQNRFRGFLTILAYCGMLAVVASILVDYANEPAKTVPGHRVEVNDPEDTPEVGMKLTKNHYESNKNPITLTIPDNWLNKVNLQQLDYGLRFYFTGRDGYQQDLITIQVEKIEDRLKFLYEGGPDPSKEIGVLEEDVYRYSYPMDNALSVAEDLKEFEKLLAEVPTVVQSFNFTGNKGLIGETP